MPDEPQAPPEDSPAPEAPVQDSPPQVPATDTPDYESRYKETQAAYTRSQQELSEYQQVIEALNSDDAELRNAAREALGLPLEEVPQEEETDPYDQRLTKLEQAILQSQEAQQADQQRQQLVDYIDGKLTEIEGQRGLEFTDPEVKAIVAQAERLVDDNGMPDVGAAVDLLDEIDKVRSERRGQKPKPPQVPPGKAGEKALDFSDRNARQQALADSIQANQEG